jgi:hypothetical protein
MKSPIPLVFKFLLAAGFFVHPFIGSAQEKYEKESRLKPSEVPAEAMAFIEDLDLPVKVRWYLEEGLQTRSVEAKFKFQKAWYSVEFDTLGAIEDVEVEVKPGKLPSPVLDAVAKRLKEDCSGYRINKTQIQYLGEKEALKSIIRTSKVGEDVTTNYELIVRCSNDKGVNLFEYLFDASGEVLSLARIIFKNSSHLEY